MPHGFFTVEQWKPSRKSGDGKWVAILHLDAYQSLSKATESLMKRNEGGLFRVVQTQRCLWGEMENGRLRLHGSHVSSIDNLGELAALYEREDGRRPVEKARQERAAAKARRSKSR